MVKKAITKVLDSFFKQSDGLGEIPYKTEPSFKAPSSQNKHETQGTPSPSIGGELEWLKLAPKTTEKMTKKTQLTFNFD